MHVNKDGHSAWVSLLTPGPLLEVFVCTRDEKGWYAHGMGVHEDNISAPTFGELLDVIDSYAGEVSK